MTFRSCTAQTEVQTPLNSAGLFNFWLKTLRNEFSKTADEQILVYQAKKVSGPWVEPWSPLHLLFCCSKVRRNTDKRRTTRAMKHFYCNKDPPTTPQHYYTNNNTAFLFLLISHCWFVFGWPRHVFSPWCCPSPLSDFVFCFLFGCSLELQMLFHIYIYIFL